MANSDYLEEIKNLETRLVRLRLLTRHIDFVEDYDRETYSSQNRKSQIEIQHHVIQYLEQLDKPIRNGDLIFNLIKNIKDLSEADFEKTGSGAIRIHSGIQTAIVGLAKTNIISRPSKGMLILTSKIKPNN